MGRSGWTALGIALLVAFLGLAESAAQEGKIVAVVLKVKSDVRQRPPAGKWEPARKGQPLFAGHELRTGEDSFCALVFQDDQSLLKVTSNTEVTLNTEEASGGRFSKRIWVGVGGIWAKVARQEETTFEIETPTSVASVKGSSCYNITEVSGPTTLYTLEGLFEFSNRFGRVNVGPGFKGFSDGVGPPALTPAASGEVPTFAAEQRIEGLEPGPGEGEGGGRHGEEGAREIRIGMVDREGTEKTLVIQVAEPEE
jgi:hypothetical protein